MLLFWLKKKKEKKKNLFNFQTFGVEIKKKIKGGDKRETKKEGGAHDEEINMQRV